MWYPVYLNMLDMHHQIPININLAPTRRPLAGQRIEARKQFVGDRGVRAPPRVPRARPHKAHITRLGANRTERSRACEWLTRAVARPCRKTLWCALLPRPAAARNATLASEARTAILLARAVHLLVTKEGLVEETAIQIRRAIRPVAEECQSWRIRIAPRERSRWLLERRWQRKRWGWARKGAIWAWLAKRADALVER